MAGEELVLDDEVHPLILSTTNEKCVTDCLIRAGVISDALEGRRGVVHIYVAVVDEPSEIQAIIGSLSFNNAASREG